MDFDLILVGAHDGSKMEPLIRQAEAVGNVLLIEPVPFLFEKLRSRYGGLAKIHLRNIAISKGDHEIEFVAPKQTANLIAHYGDQLGSLIADHAILHDKRMSEHVELIKVRSSSFETLVRTEPVFTINTLFTDLEGMDTELLPTFPFYAVIPKRIIFEFKHSDGVGRVGRKLANLLLLLEDRGYRVHVMDAENMVATHESFTA
jgi:FkbM family methyltransferase